KRSRAPTSGRLVSWLVRPDAMRALRKSHVRIRDCNCVDYANAAVSDVVFCCAVTESRNSAPSSVGLARKRLEPPQCRFADRDSGPGGLFDDRLPASCPAGAPGRGGSALFRALLFAAR